MSFEKKLIHRRFGCGGMRCACCGPAPGSEARRKLIRAGRRECKKILLKEQTDNTAE